MDISTINFDFFKNITPVSTYKLIGDKNPEMEINSVYLNNIMTKKPKKFGGSLTGRSQKHQILINVGNGDKNTGVGISDSQNTKNDIKSDNNNKSEDKISINFLGELYSKGEFSNDNTNYVELTQEQMNKFKLENHNPFVLSFNNLHPFSIFYGTKYEKLIKNNNELMLPAPNFIVKTDWCKPEDTSFDAIMEGIRIDDEQGLVIDSPELQKKFSGIVGDIILQILRVPFGHHISLNIKMFEPNTVLSRYMKLFSYANTYLLKACESNLSPYERFKYIIAFYFSGLFICCNQLKPFNPFLGETYQGEFSNGAKIYVENVTHTPLVARFLVRYKKKYEISGYWALAVNTKSLGSEMIINQKGPIRVYFPELNESFVGHIPFIKAINARSEKKRAMLFFGSLVCVDQKHNYKCWIQFNFNKKVFHEIRGCTMEYEFPDNYKFDADKEWNFGLEFDMDKDMKVNQKKTKMKGNYIIKENISGSFIDYLKIGNDVIWDIKKNLPEQITPVKYCLPSDGRFREDLQWLYRSINNKKDDKEEEIYRDIGMKWKVMMEEFNRWERKHRADYKQLMNNENKKK